MYNCYCKCSTNNKNQETHYLTNDFKISVAQSKDRLSLLFPTHIFVCPVLIQFIIQIKSVRHWFRQTSSFSYSNQIQLIQGINFLQRIWFLFSQCFAFILFILHLFTLYYFLLHIFKSKTFICIYIDPPVSLNSPIKVIPKMEISVVQF